MRDGVRRRPVIVLHRPIAPIIVFVLVAGLAGVARGQTSPTAPDAATVEQQLVAAARANPDSFAAHRALAEFYLATRRLADAIAALERARALDPAHAENGYDLAVAYLETNRLDAARTQVRALLAAKPSAELHNLLGDIDVRAGDRAAAAVNYQLAARAQPIEEHLYDWGDNLLHLGAHGDAAEVFAAAVRRHPTSARLHIGLGITQYARGQHEDAVRSFCRASDLDPKDPAPYGFLGEMYGVSPDQNGEIVQRLARFVELQPESAAGHYYYAMNLWKGASGTPDVDLARVEALLRRAVTLDSTHAKARLQLGILLSEQGRWRDAIVELRAAAALAPDQPQTHFRLAQAYRRTGQTALADEALSTFQRLKAREPAAPVPD
jgi:tetratricopeptide (TPR) repeat protein